MALLRAGSLFVALCVVPLWPAAADAFPAALKQSHAHKDLRELIRERLRFVERVLVGADPRVLDGLADELLKNPIIRGLPNRRAPDDSSLLEFEQKTTATVELLQLAGAKIELRDYLTVAIDQPSLFRSAPETIANNVVGTVELLQDLGADIDVPSFIDFKTFASVALRQPSLFYSSAKTIERNVCGAVKLLREAGVEITPKD